MTSPAAPLPPVTRTGGYWAPSEIYAPRRIESGRYYPGGLTDVNPASQNFTGNYEIDWRKALTKDLASCILPNEPYDLVTKKYLRTQYVSSNSESIDFNRAKEENLNAHMETAILEKDAINQLLSGVTITLRLRVTGSYDTNWSIPIYSWANTNSYFGQKSFGVFMFNGNIGFGGLGNFLYNGVDFPATLLFLTGSAINGGDWVTISCRMQDAGGAWLFQYFVYEGVETGITIYQPPAPGATTDTTYVYIGNPTGDYSRTFPGEIAYVIVHNRWLNQKDAALLQNDPIEALLKRPGGNI